MAEVVGLDIKSNSSSSTWAEIISMSMVPRTDAVGSRITLRVQVRMGASSALYTHSSDMSIGRVFTGTVNGHDIGWHVIKRYNLDRWEYSTTYNYDLTFDIPYSPGSVYCNFRIVEQGTGNYMNSSTFTWGTDLHTHTGGAVTPCTGVTSILIDGAALVQKGSMSGGHTLSWSGATGFRTLEYVIFVYTHVLGAWVYYTTVSGTSLGVDAATWNNISRGYSVQFIVRAQDGYTVADVASGVKIRLVNLPGAPSWMGSPSSAKFNASLQVVWGEGTFGTNYEDGTLYGYVLQVRRMAKGTAVWSDWAGLGTFFTEVMNTTPSTYSAWVVRPGDTLQFRAFTHSTYGLNSAAATESVNVLMKGGTARVKVAGVWREGIAWIKVSGVWREASSVYQKVAGIWRESV